MWGIVKSFEDCTNSLINRQKTRLLGLRIWKKRKQWPFEYLTSSQNIWVLGIVFCPTVKETIAMNLSKMQIKVRRSLWGASNRKLRVLRRAQFFNKLIVPKFIHLAKLFPLPKKRLIDMQKVCSKFIWRNRLERIALEQSHPKLTEGGLGRALFSATLIKQFLGESRGTSFLNYWIGKALKGVKPNFVGFNARETHALFSNAVNDILYVHETNPNTQWSSMNTKAFYCILINKPTNSKDIPMKPKIFADKIIPNSKVFLSYLSSVFLSPAKREHLFLILHNILLPRVRKKRLKIDTDDNCTYFKHAPEDIQHIFFCPASQPAVLLSILMFF